MKCALLGEKLSHSYSPKIHEYLGKHPPFTPYEYTLIEKKPSELEGFLKGGDFDALNVTIPYKSEVIKYCSYLSERAESISAVNTIVNRDGVLHGYNTDYYGFSLLLDKVCDVKGKKVLVLGSGGSSKTVCAVISDKGGQSRVISRMGEDNYENISAHALDTDVIVNTTPVGMYPNNLSSLIDLFQFKNLSAVIDIIYNPSKTKLLLDAEKMGIRHANGLYMLVAQAKKSAELFCGVSAGDDIIDAIASKLERQLLNIVFVGMPGCGKSHIGQLTAEKLGRSFMDSDALVFELEGKKPEEIIKTSGEEAFRRIETDALSFLCKKSSLVISTGGGAVTREENFDIIKQNSLVIWLKRPVEELSFEGRPLSKSANELRNMYEKRKNAYEKISCAVIDNDSTPEETASRIASFLTDYGI